MTLDVVVFDDNRNILDSVELLLGTTAEFRLIGKYTHAGHCIEEVRKTNPAIVLMDIEMPGINGIEATAKLKEAFPQIQILMQTVFEDDERVFESICSGASGYILKTDLNTKLIDALRELQFGGSPMSPVIARKVLNRMQQIPQYVKKEAAVDYRLTSREKEVLQCIVNGLSHKMIASELGISYETVRTYVKKIYEKLHVASLTEAVAKAINKRILR
ncbi:LuxR C-terminal-related transcriptional regulator [Negadavirga shengliensis]|uniref:LuxR C-terminal-related transcriptional regulator n=1 Tax=Negadavirga shengliensis TaxID=1389218 RepID=A0ABV9T2S3_9BACT